MHTLFRIRGREVAGTFLIRGNSHVAMPGDRVLIEVESNGDVAIELGLRFTVIGPGDEPTSVICPRVRRRHACLADALKSRASRPPPVSPRTRGPLGGGTADTCPPIRLYFSERSA
jgi:hypothetical protein